MVALHGFSSLLLYTPNEPPFESPSVTITPHAPRVIIPSSPTVAVMGVVVLYTRFAKSMEQAHTGP